jgi:chromosome segregation ATPase
VSLGSDEKLAQQTRDFRRVMDACEVMVNEQLSVIDQIKLKTPSKKQKSLLKQQDYDNDDAESKQQRQQQQEDNEARFEHLHKKHKQLKKRLAASRAECDALRAQLHTQQEGEAAAAAAPAPAPAPAASASIDAMQRRVAVYRATVDGCEELIDELQVEVARLSRSNNALVLQNSRLSTHLQQSMTRRGISAATATTSFSTAKPITTHSGSNVPSPRQLALLHSVHNNDDSDDVSNGGEDRLMLSPEVPAATLTTTPVPVSSLAV